jgi:phosphatidyl-myo-inositol dimannoside synthase
VSAAEDAGSGGRVLLITNDFPPRPGGIQQFIHNLAIRQPPGSLVVYASNWRGAAEFDAAQPFPVIRESTSMLLPTPAVALRAARLVEEFECRALWFGAAAPLGLLAGGERLGRIRRAVAMTHGHEVGWAALPGARTALRQIAANVDVFTYLGEYFGSRLARALGERTRLERLAPGVDTEAFSPQVSGAAVRQRYRLTDRPVIVCVSRLVPRKGQDMLIRALPAVRRRVADAALLLVSGGPYRSALQRLAQRAGVADHVMMTGSVDWTELPAHYAAGDVFAMPCRTRRGGLDVEGLGIVYLEASATGLPVIAGDSGGAPDAVLDGQTGYVVPGRDVAVLADRLATVLADPILAARLGAAGRSWVQREWRWDLKAHRLRELLTAG